jgi:hypothetical protein
MHGHMNVKFSWRARKKSDHNCEDVYNKSSLHIVFQKLI